ncbi:VRR-NUC domain-containing protein [Spirosoma spitsbergense]|uniref:VRR-NUC domain-containing protein n=1 Tax=Spirosoma spitsbergense TaxID=431554 RepID=UPI00038129CF|nr:VRR-NUC domain-containing protein [Spirosoma spitsbergense]
MANKLPAFRQLQAFIVEETTRKPRSTKPKPNADRPETANELTRRIVKHVQDTGHFATRLQSTGTYREDLKKFVPSQQRAGLPDVFAIVDGQAVFVEVKAGKDRLSDTQRETIKTLLRAGAFVFVAHSFQEFDKWFTAQFLNVRPV